MSTEIQQNSMWAFRALDQKDPALRNDALRAPTEEYTVPASAGLVALVCNRLGIDPTGGPEGDERWTKLRGRPVDKLYAFYQAAQEPMRNEDPNEVDRLIGLFGRKYSDELSAATGDGQ